MVSGQVVSIIKDSHYSRKKEQVSVGSPDFCNGEARTIVIRP
jgi:hypothetical protein